MAKGMVVLPLLLCSLMVLAFGQQTISRTVEDFQAYPIAHGRAVTLDCPVLNSAAICNGQGPGLVVAGFDISFNDIGQWNGGGYFGSLSKEVISNGRPLTIDFTAPVTAVAVNLRNYTGFPATAALTVYGLDGITVIGTLSGIRFGSGGAPWRVGWQADAGIGKLTLTQTGQAWSPIIDNLEFAAATAKLSLSPSGGAAGTPIAVTGTGFAANETVSVVYYQGAATVQLASLTADSGGTATGTITVPPLSIIGARGAHLVYAIGQSSGLFGAAVLTVTP